MPSCLMDGSAKDGDGTRVKISVVSKICGRTARNSRISRKMPLSTGGWATGGKNYMQVDDLVAVLNVPGDGTVHDLPDHG